MAGNIVRRAVRGDIWEWRDGTVEPVHPAPSLSLKIRARESRVESQRPRAVNVGPSPRSPISDAGPGRSSESVGAVRKPESRDVCTPRWVRGCPTQRRPGYWLRRPHRRFATPSWRRTPPLTGSGRRHNSSSWSGNSILSLSRVTIVGSRGEQWDRGRVERESRSRRGSCSRKGRNL